jgi:hypothetical protein
VLDVRRVLLFQNRKRTPEAVAQPQRLIENACNLFSTLPSHAKDKPPETVMEIAMKIWMFVVWG